MNLDLRKVPFYYINLERQPERMEKMEELLSSLEIEEYYRIDAKPHQNGFVGCAQTVADVLDTLQSSLFVLLEDDIALKNWEPIIDIPDDTDAFYLGISGWGRMNGHSGPCVQHEKVGNNIVRIRNMLSDLMQSCISVMSGLRQRREHVVLLDMKFKVSMMFRLLRS